LCQNFKTNYNVVGHSAERVNQFITTIGCGVIQ
jgi:hypothetical protein